MFDISVYLNGFAIMLALAAATWVISVARRDVSIVDSLWSIFFLAAAIVYSGAQTATMPRTALVIGLVAVWALRLAGHLTWRNWGEPEDRRYRAIRARNEPHFALKSLYLVFGLQAVLAWVISLPLLAAITSPRALGMLDLAGALVVVFGILYESLADWQLARFRADPRNRGRVLDSGLWRHSRHPNYFGECCVWWGFWLMALAAGAWWSIVAPLLMTVLLLRVSGVAMLERDIGGRRPAYRDYIARTNAFVPGPRHPPRAAGR